MPDVLNQNAKEKNVNVKKVNSVVVQMEKLLLKVKTSKVAKMVRAQALEMVLKKSWPIANDPHSVAALITIQQLTEKTSKDVVLHCRLDVVPTTFRKQKVQTLKAVVASSALLNVVLIT